MAHVENYQVSPSNQAQTFKFQFRGITKHTPIDNRGLTCIAKAQHCILFLIKAKKLLRMKET